MKRGDSDHPVTCNFQIQEDSQDPEQKLFLKLTAQNIILTECFPVFYSENCQKVLNFFPTFIF